MILKKKATPLLSHSLLILASLRFGGVLSVPSTAPSSSPTEPPSISQQPSGYPTFTQQPSGSPTDSFHEREPDKIFQPEDDQDISKYGKQGEIGIGNDTTYGDPEWGNHLAISKDGNTIAIGSPYSKLRPSAQNSTDEDEKGRGYVNIYRKEANEWIQIGNKIRGTELPDKNKPANINGSFGQSVSLSEDGNAIAIGSVEEDGDPTNGYVRSYNYNATETKWTVAYKGFSGYVQKFGRSVSLSDDKKWLGIATENAINIIEIENNTTGVEKQIITDDRGNKETVIIAGSSGNNKKIVALATSSGVGIYNISGDIRYDNVNNKIEDDRIGNELPRKQGDSNVAITNQIFDDKQTVIVAIGHSEKVGSAQVYIYNNVKNKWDERGQQLGSGKSEKFGGSIAMSANGNYLAVGDDENGKGSVYVYSYNEYYELWINFISLKGRDDEHFGKTIVLSGDGKTLAVGAPKRNNMQGAVYVYDIGISIPSAFPSETPSLSVSPSELPSHEPSEAPTKSNAPSDSPSFSPSEKPTASQNPSLSPSNHPTDTPTITPRPSASSSPTSSPKPTGFCLKDCDCSKVNCSQCESNCRNYTPAESALSVCKDNCHCSRGGCLLKNCERNCDCNGGYCQMPLCKSSCECKGGYCNMNLCETNCCCPGRGCNMAACIYLGTCTNVMQGACSEGVTHLGQATTTAFIGTLLGVLFLW